MLPGAAACKQAAIIGLCYGPCPDTAALPAACACTCTAGPGPQPGDSGARRLCAVHCKHGRVSAKAHTVPYKTHFSLWRYVVLTDSAWCLLRPTRLPSLCFLPAPPAPLPHTHAHTRNEMLQLLGNFVYRLPFSLPRMPCIAPSSNGCACVRAAATVCVCRMRGISTYGPKRISSINVDDGCQQLQADCRSQRRWPLCAS